MPETDDRFEAFKADLRSMGLADPNPGRDQQLGRLGAVLMVAGIAIGVYAYFGLSNATTNALQQRDAIVVAVTGLTVSVVGAALFLRASLATFLRFWFARLSHEQHRIIDALGSSDV